MEVIAGIFILLLIAGVGLTIYEKRKGITWVDERDPTGAQSEADRDRMRAEDAARGHGGDIGH